jgi:SPP1 gp7 family putative phage head morphogenesis protein
LSIVIKNLIFKKVLENNGITEGSYYICWNQLNEEETNKKIDLYTKVLSSGSIGTGMKKEIEKKIAALLEIDYDSVEEYEEEEKQASKQDKDNEFENQLALKKMQMTGKESTENIRRNSIYESSHICEGKLTENINVFKWLNKDVSNIKDKILDGVANDSFEMLKADNREDIKNGYLSETQIRTLREIFFEAISKNKGIFDIRESIKDKLKLEHNRAELISRTELTRLLNKGILEGRKPTFIQWDATIDESTCPVCAGLNGAVFTLSTLPESQRPPVHPNCRCNIEELGKEESLLNTIKEAELKDLAPQELEAALIKHGIKEDKAKKFIESLQKINKNIVTK